MKFLIAHGRHDLLELYGDIIESVDESLVILKAESYQKAQTILRKEDIDCIICDQNLPGGSGLDLFVFSKTQGRIPFALSGDKEAESIPEYEEYKKDIFSYILQSQAVPSILNVVTALKKKKNKATKKSSYTRVRMGNLSKMKTMVCDIYLQLSEKKHVKVMNSGGAFTKKDFNRYENKGLAYLYIKKEDSRAFMRQLLKSIEESLKIKVSHKDNVMDLARISHLAIYDSIQSLGVTPEAQELIQVNMQMAIDTVKDSDISTRLFSKLESNPEAYINVHSTALSFLTCALASVMPWRQESSYYKLSLAAILHDISLSNHKLAAIQNLEDLEKNKELFKQKEREEYKKHPLQIAQMVRNIESIPPDVDNIILQHHEQPDGKGFPHKLRAPRISHLSSLFIISHDIIHFLLRENGTIQDYFEKNKQKFRVGQFRTIFVEVEKILS